MGENERFFVVFGRIQDTLVPYYLSEDGDFEAAFFNAGDARRDMALKMVHRFPDEGAAKAYVLEHQCPFDHSDPRHVHALTVESSDVLFAKLEDGKRREKEASEHRTSRSR